MTGLERFLASACMILAVLALPASCFRPPSPSAADSGLDGGSDAGQNPPYLITLGCPDLQEGPKQCSPGDAGQGQDPPYYCQSVAQVKWKTVAYVTEDGACMGLYDGGFVRMREAYCTLNTLLRFASKDSMVCPKMDPGKFLAN